MTDNSKSNRKSNDKNSKKMSYIGDEHYTLSLVHSINQAALALVHTVRD